MYHVPYDGRLSAGFGCAGTLFFCDFNKPQLQQARATKKGAVLALLRHRQSQRSLLVVAAHPSVPLGPEGRETPEVPVAEMKQLMLKVDEIYRWNQQWLGRFPWIFAGDLNSVHTTTVGAAAPLVYYFMRTSGGLSSSYKHVLGREPPFTSVRPEFRHTIDYILQSGAGLVRRSAVVHRADQASVLI